MNKPLILLSGIFILISRYKALKSSCRNMDVKEGDDVNVTCTFEQDISQTALILYVYQNEETVVSCTWSGGNINCSPKMRNFRIVGPITNQLILNIANVTRSNGGFFRCIAEGSISDDITSCLLNVYVPEIITTTFSSVTTSRTSPTSTTYCPSLAEELDSCEGVKHAYFIIVILLIMMLAAFVTTVILLYVKYPHIIYRWISPRLKKLNPNPDPDSVALKKNITNTN